MVSRRDLMKTSAIAGFAGAAAAAGTPGYIAISSVNGLRACAKAVEMMKAGHDTLDAAIAGVNIQELDPEDNSVGYGGLPNEEGVVELDASVMHGPTRRCGSVGAIRGVKTPSNIAKLVMEHTTHVMLVGEGASRFARAMGFKEEDLLTEKSRLAWLVWKQSMRDKAGHTNWSPEDTPIKPTARLREMYPSADAMLAWAEGAAAHPPTGTINCLAMNPRGEISGVTTTSGLAWKLPGRVGDSPIIGAGLYVDQDYGAAGSTGLGEENIRVAGAHTVVENMRRGMTPKEACLDALKRIQRNYDKDTARLSKFDINFYALRKDGLYAGTTLWGGQQVLSVNDGGASRHEPCVGLLQR